VRGRAGGEGRELEFILRSLVELKLQVEELKRRLDDLGHGAADRMGPGQWIGEAPLVASVPRGGGYVVPGALPGVGAIEPRAHSVEHAVTIRPGMTMAEIERAAIESALRETRGNRRKAADLLQIGERTLYRKIREYEVLGGIPGEEGGDEVAVEDTERRGLPELPR
jgi:DNA-binding NtrC family response regulator